MILNPAIIALLLGSLVTAVLLAYASAIALQVVRRWDRSSSGEGQLLLERKTGLVSAMLGYVLAFQLLSLFLFIHTADALHPLFTGAMCAAGTLNVNGYGYPALLLKLAVTLAAGLWLIANHADSRGYDFPLVRPKYAALLLFAPASVVESALTLAYFLNLKADVITSCCGSLFGSDQGTFAGGIASLPPLPAVTAFYATAGVALAAAVILLLRGKGAPLLAVAAAATLATALGSLISVFALYIYEIPTHHCPFCILQREYGGIGYLFYSLLLVGVISGMGCGVLHPARTVPSLRTVLPPLQRRLALLSLLCLSLYSLLVTWYMVASPFTMEW